MSRIVGFFVKAIPDNRYLSRNMRLDFRLVLLLLPVLGLHTPFAAKTVDCVTVDTTFPCDPSCTSGICCSIAHALSLPSVDKIIISPGTYSGANNRNISISLRPPISLSCPSRACVVDCGAAAPALCITNSTNSLVFEGIRFQNCGSVSSCGFEGPYGQLGGAIAIQFSSSISFIDCAVAQTRNVPSSRVMGGAVGIMNSQVMFSGSSFVDNNATYGAGVFFGGLSGLSPVFERCQFVRNDAIEWGGGAYAEDATHAVFTNCLFDANSARVGAAFDDALNSATQFHNCDFVRNFAVEDGSGIFTYGQSKASFFSSRFLNNRSGRRGGVVVQTPGTNPSFINCTFEGNSAFRAGVLSLQGASATPLQFASCAFVNNSAEDIAVVEIASTRVRVVFSNCSFVSNTAEFGPIFSAIAPAFVAVENSLAKLNTAENAVFYFQSTRAGSAVIGLRCIENSVRLQGGCVFLDSLASLSILNSSFIGNMGRIGSAIYAYGYDSYINITNSNFTSNVASLYGGAVFTSRVATAQFDGCIFDGNSVVDKFSTTTSVFARSGGAMYVLGRISVRDVVFVGNMALVGGGLFVGREASFDCNGFASLRFCNNSANFGGSAIYFDVVSTGCAQIVSPSVCAEETLTYAPASLRFASLSNPDGGDPFPGALLNVTMNVLDVFGRIVVITNPDFTASLRFVVPRRDARFRGEISADVANGVAVFDEFRIDGVPGPYVLTLDPSLPLASLSNFSITLSPCASGYSGAVVDGFFTCRRTIEVIAFEHIIALGVLCAIVIALTFAATVFVALFRSTKVIKASSPLFIFVILAGIVIFTIGAFVLALTQNLAAENPLVGNGLCRSLPWLFGFGFIAIFGTLASKTYRIYRLFVKAGLRKVAMKDNHLFKQVIAMAVAEAIIDAAWTGSDPLTIINIEITPNRFLACQSYYGGLWLGAWGALKASILCWGVYLAFRTRNVTTTFNESKAISFSIYNITVMVIVVIAVDRIVVGSVTVKVGVIVYSAILISVISLLALIAPKVALLLAVKKAKRDAMMVALETSSG